MTSFKNYFLYIFKRSIPRLIVIAAISLITTMWEIIAAKNYTSLYTTSLILCVLCTVVPPLELAAFKNRRNADMLFSLPVSRKKQAIAHWLNGLIQALGTYILCFLGVVVSSAFLELKNVGHFVGYFFISLIFGALVYSVLLFAFNQACTVVDGVIFEILVAFGSGLAVTTFLGGVLNFDVFKVSYMVYAPLSDAGLYQIVKNGSFALPFESVLMCILLAALGGACIFGYIFSFERARAEKIGGISDSYIGYRSLIPIWAYSLLASVGSILFIFIYIAVVVGYIIFRRGFKFTREDAIAMMGGLPFLLLGYAWVYWW